MDVDYQPLRGPTPRKTEPRSSTGEVSGQTSTPARRLIELDILRGFLLAWMTLTHLPTKASLVSNQTFGFVSGAEGFIFLSAFMLGQLENRIEQRRRLIGTLRDVFKRTARVYAYHELLVAIAFTVFAYIASAYGRQSLQNLLSYFFEDPKGAVVAALVLAYRPSLLDILPMYVIFLALTPLARFVARRWGWQVVAGCSCALWAVAQFGLRGWLYRHVDIAGLAVPENSTGAFDIYAWQLLWMVGLALGSVYSAKLLAADTSKAMEEQTTLPSWTLSLSIATALVLLCLRYLPVDQWIDPNLYGWLIDKWHLGAVRVLNFSAIAIVLVRFGHHLAAFPIFKPLAALGQASLEVFSIHVLCCFIGDALSRDPDPHLSWWLQALLLIGTFAALFLTARIVNLARKMRSQSVPSTRMSARLR